jgi:hypothetical protein
MTAAQLGYLLEGIDWRMPRRNGGRKRRADCGIVNLVNGGWTDAEVAVWIFANQICT